MGIEEGTFCDEFWVLYGNQFDNKFHTLKKNKKFKKFKKEEKIKLYNNKKNNEVCVCNL